LFTDDYGFLYAFYKGEVDKALEFLCTPGYHLIDKDIAVYKDNYGYLKGIFMVKNYKF
jgi:hypothetical protein